jgi:hypothetical protein
MERCALAEADDDDAFGFQPSTGWDHRDLAVTTSNFAALAHVGQRAAGGRVECRKTRRRIAVGEQPDRERVRLNLGWALGVYHDLHAAEQTFLIVMCEARHFYKPNIATLAMG